MSRQFLTPVGLPSGDTLPAAGSAGNLFYKADESRIYFHDGIDWVGNYSPDTRIVVKNDSGVSLTAGTAVMAAGAVGDQIRVAKAVADGSVEPRFMLGVMYETVADGSSGFMTITGEVPKLNTAAYTIGDVLYIDPETPGGFTTTQPSSPDLAMAIAIVTRVNSSSGRIFVRMWAQQSGLHELHDVLLTSPTSGEVLSYNGTLWVNSAPSIGSGNLDGGTATSNFGGITNILGGTASGI